jgi:hypothetical protein
MQRKLDVAFTEEEKLLNPWQYYSVENTNIGRPTKG